MVLLEANWLTEQSRWSGSGPTCYQWGYRMYNASWLRIKPPRDSATQRVTAKRERQPHPLPSKIGWMRNRGQRRPDPILLYKSCNLFSNRLSLAAAANLVASHKRNHNNNKKWWMKEMVRKMRGKGKLSNLHTIYINSCVRVWL